ncbi:DUF6520 family protein [Flavobacterium muglaense]|uniref:Secreted protein n=1 Tax=Flavobacterium muglaense TaxID=2764716 RepID=A0A923MY99_9FLAO|nr:DUF6520 family protein [Flavobacterium muglaense]MBC5836705.1 hypothetical protein [Flavobacterium muglaense]MBC5843345.1 hypothetical protein [Flavobacterium muglaense]
MKTFLKKMLPMFLFVLGITGALMTMSMNVHSASPNLVIGWAADEDDRPCQIEVQCQEDGGVMCRQNDTGPQAYEKTGPTSCPTELFKVGS